MKALSKFCHGTLLKEGKLGKVDGQLQSFI